jgi:hypothetical protein
MISTMVLLLLTPKGTLEFWLTLAALLGLVAMHAVYWLVTHPVNKIWLQGENLSGLGAGFFSFASTGGQRETRPADWTDLRDRWEYSHVARAALSSLSLAALVPAIS